MGMLCVREEARGRGLGSLIVSHLAQLQFQRQLPAFVLVSKENQASWKLHEKLGFRTQCAVEYITLFNCGKKPGDIVLK